MATALARTIWIANDFHGTSLGTASNPFDGSTAEKFDPIMRALVPGTRVRLMDGLFETSGSRNFNEDRGWFMPDDCHIIGNGPERTTIKKVFFPQAAIGNGHATVQMQYTAAGGVVVSDLCVDENWQGDFEDYATSAVHLYGDNCSILNVWAKNGYGNKAKGREAFTLSICARGDESGWKINSGALLGHCRVFDFRGDYGIGICTPGGPDGTGSVEAYIFRNEVTRYPGTSAYGVASRSLLEDNVSSSCPCHYYTELANGSMIVNATMGPTEGFGVYLHPVMGPISNIVIEGCKIDVSGVGIALSKDGAGCSGITIRSNRITGKGDGINAESVAGLVIEENQIPEGMKSFLTDCPDRIVRANKIVGFPIGLEDA